MQRNEARSLTRLPALAMYQLRLVPRLVLGTLISACADDGRASTQVTTPPPASGDVRFTVDLTRTTPISPYIYGMNAYTDDIGKAAWEFPWFGATPPAGVTMNRFGGNRLSAYNWENNFSNAGNDADFSNDDFLSESSSPGEAVRSRVLASFARDAGLLVTVPMLGHVAADRNGGTGSSASQLEQRLATRFVPSFPAKGAPFSLPPKRDDRAVYQDEFVHWLRQTFPASMNAVDKPLMISLDNEPDIWGATHEEIKSKVADKMWIQSYDEFIATTIEYARAIKDVAPDVVVFGPAVATWAGAATLGRWPTPDPKYGAGFFFDTYLSQLRAHEQSSGKRLVDVLDLHWYPAGGAGAYEITNDYAPQTAAMIDARVQAPRSLWDPTYDERSWVSEVQAGPIKLLPYLKEKVATHYPGTKIAITEYYYGRGGDISGGIAQADALGIFGREGVFAAMVWPNVGVWSYGGDGKKAYAYLFGAFRSFRDYDGKGGRFGDLATAASTSDPERSSIYASVDQGSATSRVVLVAINKSSSPLAAEIVLSDAKPWTRGEVYVMSDGSPNPTRKPDLTGIAGNKLVYQMPPMSVSTLVLKP
jgi:hypothetical protein